MPRKKDPNNTLSKTCPTCKKTFECEKRKEKTYCSKSCSANSDVVKEKNRKAVKATFKEKYGGHPMAVNDATKEKLSNKIEELYGKKHFSQTKLFVEKVKETKLNKYGNENYNNLEKMKNTLLEKYGVDNYRKTDEYKEKYVSTCIKKYGIEHASKSKEYKDSHKKLMFEKFMNSERFKNFEIKFTFEEYNGVTTKFNQKYPFKCKRCGNSEEHDISDGKDVRCSYCDKTMSYFQGEVVEYIKSLIPNEAIVTNNRAILSPLELDIYIPSKNIAIETNGLYWHSEVSGKKNKSYHLNKMRLCVSKGIRLIHIFENEWKHKKDIVKSVLASTLSKSNKVLYARKCEIRELNTREKSDFLNNNHLQGNDHATVKIGLIHDEEVVSVMTFVKSRFDKKIQWEMSRFCTKLNTNVVGGSSRLFTYFVKNYSPNTIVSYSDRRYFSGETYLKLKFNFVDNTPPNYHYIIDGYDTLQSRINWQKGKLSKKLLSFDNTLSEWENMKMNGFDRIWDCGHTKWIWRK